MATVSEIVERARRRLGVQEAEEPLQAYEADEGRKALNDMLASWVLEKVILAAPNLTSLTQTVSVDSYGVASLTDEANEAFISCLAVRLADNYGTTASATTVNMCQRGKDAIMAASFDPGSLQASFDSALTIMPSQRLYGVRDQ